MPNIQTKHLDFAGMLAACGDFTFHALATSPHGERLLLTRYKEKSFFLSITPKSTGYLIKCDKLTRMSPVSIIQNALKAFAKAQVLELTFSNLGTDDDTQDEENATILKNAHYFVKDFQTQKRIWIEIGFGSGRHLLHQAKQHPDVQFIGLEIHRPSIEQVINQCALQKIENIVICDFDARVFLQLLSSNSVGKIFVHFPVPWDKKPHRRVISGAFVHEALRVLHRDGTLELRTDSEDYFRFAFETIEALSHYQIAVRKNHDLFISSKYEDRWKRQQKNIYDLTLTNTHESLKKESFRTLTFEKSYDFKRVKKKFTNTVFRGEDYFVHFEDLYEIDENSGIIKLSLGAYEKCEHKYLLFKDNMIEYFPNGLLPIEQNYKSHAKVKELLDV